MPMRKPSRRKLRTLCAEVHPDDGNDPRLEPRGGGKVGRSSWKARQLCRQVAERLDDLFSGECGDDVLRDLQVVDVRPAPDITRLLVTVRVLLGPRPTAEVLDHLDRASGLLRREVAAAVTRRRAPSLAFQVAMD